MTCGEINLMWRVSPHTLHRKGRRLLGRRGVQFLSWWAGLGVPSRSDLLGNRWLSYLRSLCRDWVRLLTLSCSDTGELDTVSRHFWFALPAPFQHREIVYDHPARGKELSTCLALSLGHLSDRQKSFGNSRRIQGVKKAPAPRYLSTCHSSCWFKCVIQQTMTMSAKL
jgi:hypothetical protein